MNTTTRPTLTVGKCYRWKGPKCSFYMGQCSEVEGSRVRFDGGPWMLDDGRYIETEPGRGLVLRAYSPEGVTV